MGRPMRRRSKVSSDEPTAHAILERALEAGINFIDTADVYGQDGLSERVIGKWFTDRKTRDDHMLFLEDGQPMVFGVNSDKGIVLGEHLMPEVVDPAQAPIVTQ